MQDVIKIGTAAAGGYVLGRTKKAKAAIGLALFIAGRRHRPADIARDQAVKFARSDRGQEMLAELRGPMLNAGREAALSVFENRVGRLGDALQRHTEGLGSADGSRRGRRGRDRDSEEEPEYDDEYADEYEDDSDESDQEYADEYEDDSEEPDAYEDEYDDSEDAEEPDEPDEDDEDEPDDRRPASRRRAPRDRTRRRRATQSA